MHEKEATGAAGERWLIPSTTIPSPLLPSLSSSPPTLDAPFVGLPLPSVDAKGAGKTTVLQHVLNNNEGVRVGLLVNDVAATNIDAKLLRPTNKPAATTTMGLSTRFDAIELQNGCACCSLSDELFLSLDRLLSLGEQSEQGQFQHVVIECSGVAEPKKMRENFADAVEDGAPIMDDVLLHNIVCVADAADFLRFYDAGSKVKAHPEIGSEPDNETGDRMVVDLLVEQLECADAIVLNKVDRVTDAEKDKVSGLLRTVNSLATVHATQFGKIDLDVLLGRSPDAPPLIPALNTEGHHRADVESARQSMRRSSQQRTGHHHGHSHAHGHDGRGHGHDHHGHDHHGHDHHGHDHHHGDEKNGHHHDHHHGDEKNGHHHDHHHGDEKNGHHHDHHGHHDHHHGDEKHGHQHHGHHDHHHDHGAECTAEGCTHEHHHHHHHHEDEMTTAEKRFGIRSFVYESRRPFSVDRVMQMLLPGLDAEVSPETEILLRSHSKDGAGTILRKARDGENAEAHPMKSVLRSKGFLWLNSHHHLAMYWSHAGRHFEIRPEGDWWCTVDEGDWPTDAAQREIILSDFVSVDHSIAAADKGTGVRAASFSPGDRRNELVVIGIKMDDDAIREALDRCLLDDAEFEEYLVRWKEYPDPQIRFVADAGKS